MRFEHTDLDNCHTATGLVIVVDVIRAFTNAAFAFSRGAEKIYPVSTVEEALLLKSQMPGALVCGEVGGIAPPGFDFGNSPSQTRELDLTGRTVIQRTGAGTQGIVRSVNARTMLAASLVVANATVSYVRALDPDAVTFVITGEMDGDRGDEDMACAEYLQLILMNKQPDPEPYTQRVMTSRDALFHLDPNMPAFPRSDLDHCTHVDAFDFAMPVSRENGRHAIHRTSPTA